MNMWKCIILGLLVTAASCSKNNKPDRVGELEIGQTYTVDIDRGKFAPKSGADLWFQAKNDKDKFLVPQNGAKVALVPRWWDKILGCSMFPLKENPIDLNKIMEGKILCLETDLGKRARIQIMGKFENSLLTFVEIYGDNLPEPEWGEKEIKETLDIPMEPGRMGFIKENLEKIAHEQFPDNTHNSWRIKSTVHDGDMTYVEAIPTPQDVGYESFKFLLFFESDNVGENIAVYAKENGEYSLLSYNPLWKEKIRETPF